MTDDLVPLYADFGATVTRADSSTFAALLDSPSADALDVRAGTHRLRYVTDAAADLTEGEAITIDSDAYTVAEPPRRINDGSETIVGLYAA